MKDDIFISFLRVYLRNEYERMLWKILNNKDDDRYEYAKKELGKLGGKPTNKDIISKIHADHNVYISKRTVVRWSNKARKGLESIVEKYSDTPLDDEKWYRFLEEANNGYALYSGNHSGKKIDFDKAVLWLIILAEDMKK